MINGVHILRALVDNEASFNLIPTSTLDAAGISRKKIQGIPMEVIGFGGAAEYIVGHIQLVLKVGPIVLSDEPNKYDDFGSAESNS